MKRIAIIFDNYGNPGQPFLLEWFLRIRKSTAVLVRGFTDKLHGENIAKVYVFKKSGLNKIGGYFWWKARILKRPALSSVPFQYYELFDFDPDVIHVLNAQHLSVYKDVIKRAGSRLVVSFRGYETSVRTQADADWKKELKTIYHFADRLHFVSDFLMREAMTLGAPADKCVVIRRSVDTDFFSPRSSERNESLVKLLAVGRLTWQKGYDILLRSVYELMTEGHQLRLAIIGEGRDKESLQTLVRSLSLEAVVEFCGHLDREHLREALRSADIFVQASVSDALPNSVLEASACGLPVVSTTAGGIPEAVRSGFSGILVEPGNVMELANALRNVIVHPRLRRTFGENGRNLMKGEFSAAVEASRWETFYSNIA